MATKFVIMLCCESTNAGGTWLLFALSLTIPRKGVNREGAEGKEASNGEALVGKAMFTFMSAKTLD